MGRSTGCTINDAETQPANKKNIKKKSDFGFSLHSRETLVIAHPNIEKILWLSGHCLN